MEKVKGVAAKVVKQISKPVAQNPVAKGGMLALGLGALVAGKNLGAEIREATVVRIQTIDVVNSYYLRSDDGRMFRLIASNSFVDAVMLVDFIEKGSKIRFEDKYVLEGSLPNINRFYIVSIDGMNIVEMFPSFRNDYKFSAAEYDKQQKANNGRGGR